MCNSCVQTFHAQICDLSIFIKNTFKEIKVLNRKVQALTAIHPPLIWGQVVGAEVQTSLSPATSSSYPGEHRGIPRSAERYNLSNVSWVCPAASSLSDMPGASHPGSKHLNLLLLMSSSSGSTLSNSPTLYPISKGEASHTLEKANFHHYF